MRRPVLVVAAGLILAAAGWALTQLLDGVALVLIGFGAFTAGQLLLPTRRGGAA